MSKTEAMSEGIMKQLQSILSNECPDLLNIGNDLKYIFFQEATTCQMALGTMELCPLK